MLADNGHSCIEISYIILEGLWMSILPVDNYHKIFQNGWLKVICEEPLIAEMCSGRENDEIFKVFKM